MTTLPKTLYKYKPFDEYTKEILFQKKIYFSCFEELNDPFEIYHIYEAINLLDKKLVDFVEYINDERGNLISLPKDLKTVLKTGSEFCKQNHNTILKFKFKNYLDRIGFYCLSEDNLNDVLWTYYNSHKGICIGFDYELLTKTFSEIGKFHFLPVQYLSELPKLGTGEIKEFRKELICGTKHIFYENEKEYRFFSFFESKEDRFIKIPPKAIKEVIFGCNFNYQENFCDMAELKVKANLEHCKFSKIVRKGFGKIDIEPSQFF